MTRAPCLQAFSVEPSVEPLSATTTSPRMPASLKAAVALSMQNAMDCASLRQGITTETSRASFGISSVIRPLSKAVVITNCPAFFDAHQALTELFGKCTGFFCLGLIMSGQNHNPGAETASGRFHNSRLLVGSFTAP